MKFLSISDDRTHALVEIVVDDALAICNMVVAVRDELSEGDIHPRIGVIPDHLQGMYDAAAEILDMLPESLTD